ncbi:MAG: RDD family protein [Microscillaceae bacterium]|nr:RDD family protein [Microscillaceae bacterium]
MKKLTFQTPQNVTLSYEPASIGDRMLATFIDMLIVWGIIIGLALIFFNTPLIEMDLWVPFQILLVFIYLMYDLVLEFFLNGQTIGKRQRGLKIIKTDGSEPTIGNYLMRWMLRPLDMGFFAMPAIMSIALTGRGQRLGDLAGDTAVVKTGSSLRLADIMQFNDLPEFAYEPTYLQVTLLSDNDINIIKDTLRSYQKNFNPDLVNKLAEKVKKVLNVESNESALRFLQRIVQDYVFLMAQKEDEVYQ